MVVEGHAGRAVEHRAGNHSRAFDVTHTRSRWQPIGRSPRAHIMETFELESFHRAPCGSHRTRSLSHRKVRSPIRRLPLWAARVTQRQIVSTDDHNSGPARQRTKGLNYRCAFQVVICDGFSIQGFILLARDRGNTGRMPAAARGERDK
ncbi:hypothetical protein AAFF_G00231610 [Aldrovandia affinis]|uniref:Uncharacterized protein n=1 Tax=Aldrovandia affinis TaxID=143900 RepID=A0AAD7W452_9TELE|nr:hypothetical protein AAFF_G00231610 [Aldrovandia affinis]